MFGCTYIYRILFVRICTVCIYDNICLVTLVTVLKNYATLHGNIPQERIIFTSKFERRNRYIKMYQ